MDKWARMGLQMVGNNWRAWECALEYFRLSPMILKKVDLIFAYKWAFYGSQLAQLSSDAAVEYFRSSPFFFAKYDISTMKSWVESGRQLISDRHGSSKLAALFFQLSPHLINDIGFADFKEWAQLATEIAKWGTDLGANYLQLPSDKLCALSASLRLEVFSLTRSLAKRSGKLALQLYQLSPDVLLKIPERTREWSMEVTRTISFQFPERAVAVLPLIQQSLRKIPLEAQGNLLKHALKLARLDGEIAQEYIAHLPQLVELAPYQHLEDWVREGTVMAEKNREAGIAYFSLESKTSLDYLRRAQDTVYLDDISRILQLFTEGLSGKRVGVRSVSQHPKGLKGYTGYYPFTDGENIYLPLSNYEFGSQSLNFMYYKLSTAHQAGYFEFGSFHVSTMLGKFFKKFAKPQLARDIFYLVEDGRIDFLLKHYYRGLRKDFERLITYFLGRRPPINSFPLQQSTIECLVHLSTGQEINQDLPPILWPLVVKLKTALAPIFQVHSQPGDSLNVTEEVYKILERVPNVPIELIGKMPGGKSLENMGFTELQNSKQLSDNGESGTAFFSEEVDFSTDTPLSPYVKEETYLSPEILPYRGETKPELIQKLMRVRETMERMASQKGDTFFPMSSEELKRLLELGLEIEIEELDYQEMLESSGLFITNLDLKSQMDKLRKSEKLDPLLKQETLEVLETMMNEQNLQGRVFFYDEWDYLINDYRPKWCSLKEVPLVDQSPQFVQDTIKDNLEMVIKIRRQFQRIRPELYRKIKKLVNGEELDLDAAIGAIVDKHSGRTPSEKIYQMRKKADREVSTLFLLDLSASTDEWVDKEAYREALQKFDWEDYHNRRMTNLRDPKKYTPGSEKIFDGKKIIDVEKEALVIMAEALEPIGDDYAIYGFSGYGRDNVEFFLIKDFEEQYSELCKGKIGGIKPFRSTRMGPAIRHAVYRLSKREAKLKVLIILSDGYPQDYDYGKDRTKKEYGINDTKMAMREAREKGIHTFCITVDKEGYEYLEEMCGQGNYLVIEDIASLPQKLPKIYRRLTT